MAYDLTITGPARRTVFEIKGDPSALGSDLLPPWPDRPCRLTRQDDRAFLSLGAHRWLLIAPPDHEDGLDAALSAVHHPDASVVLLSDSLAFFTLSGRDADVAMSIACPLDLHPGAFGPDACAQTDGFGVRALVLRQGDGWLLAVEQAYAPYIAAQLAQIV